MGADGAFPFVSVVVAAQDAGGELETCLASLAHLDYPTERREVLVVVGKDDAEPPTGTVPAARVIHESRTGVSHARNAGIAASQGDIVAFTDPDCAVSTAWLRELVRPFADDTVGAAAGAIVPYPPATDAERFAARRLSHSQLRPLAHPDRPFAMTPNLAFRREVFDRIGTFDTAFPGGGWEDADLCWRFSRGTGLELRYAPRAVVFHRYRSTGRAFFVQHYRYGYGLGLIARKYPGELQQPWRRRARAYGELARAVVRWIAGAVAWRLGFRHGDDPAMRGFALLRLLGQRAGVVRAALVPRAISRRNG